MHDQTESKPRALVDKPWLNPTRLAKAGIFCLWFMENMQFSSHLSISGPQIPWIPLCSGRWKLDWNLLNVPPIDRPIEGRLSNTPPTRSNESHFEYLSHGLDFNHNNISSDLTKYAEWWSWPTRGKLRNWEKYVKALFCLFGSRVEFLKSSSTTRLHRGRAPRQSVWQFYVLLHMRQRWETMTSVWACHIILTPTQPVGSGRPQRESNPGPPHQESRALRLSNRAPPKHCKIYQV